MRLRATSSATATGSMAASSRADCAPSAFGTSLPYGPHPGRMASGVSVWTTSLSSAKQRRFLKSHADYYNPVRTHRLCIRMRRFPVRFVRPESFVHTDPRRNSPPLRPSLCFRYTHGAQERVALLLWLRLNYCLISSGIFYHEACALGPRRRLAVWRDRPRFSTEPIARGEGNGGTGATLKKVNWRPTGTGTGMNDGMAGSNKGDARNPSGPGNVGSATTTPPARILAGSDRCQGRM
jgi:hypothetical protein